MARLWKSSGIALANIPSPLQHGWSKHGGIQWTEDNDDEYKDEPEVEESGPDRDQNI